MNTCLNPANNRPNSACFFAQENWFQYTLDPSVNSARISLDDPLFNRNGIAKAAIQSALRNIDIGANLRATAFSDTACTLNPRALITGNNDVDNSFIRCLLIERIGSQRDSVVTTLNEIESTILSLAYLFGAILLIFLVVIVVLSILILFVKYTTQSTSQAASQSKVSRNVRTYNNPSLPSDFNTLSESFAPPSFTVK